VKDTENIRFAICVINAEYPMSLELDNVYRVLPDEEAEADGDLRVVDERGEDYLYPADYFDQVDPATAVLSAMRRLMNKPPSLKAIRSEIKGLPDEQIFEALDVVQVAYRADVLDADPYKTFLWNVKRPSRLRSSKHEAPQVSPGSNRMRD
jgi:hypothetical protein